MSMEKAERKTLTPQEQNYIRGLISLDIKAIEANLEAKQQLLRKFSGKNGK